MVTERLGRPNGTEFQEVVRYRDLGSLVLKVRTFQLGGGDGSGEALGVPVMWGCGE